MSYCLDLSNSLQIIGTWIYNWQTLLSGLLALAAAIWAGSLLNKQMRQTAHIEDEKRVAQLSVARAKLALASSAIARHAAQCISILETIEPIVKSRARQQITATSVPALSLEVQDVLDGLVANTIDENALFAVSAIYAEQQVLSARMEDLHANPGSHVLAIDYYILQPIIIHAFAMSLLLYGRRETKVVNKVEWADLQSSAKALLKNTSIRDRLLALISDKAERRIKLPFALNQIDD